MHLKSVLRWELLDWPLRWFTDFMCSIVVSISWHIAGVYDVSSSFMPCCIMCNEIREECVQYLQAWWLKMTKKYSGNEDSTNIV